MAYKTQWNQISIDWLHTQEDYTTTNLHQWYTSSTCQYNEISLYDVMPCYGRKEHIKKKWWAQHQVQENVLVARTQFWAVSPQ
jgi:hypothetical protein